MRKDKNNNKLFFKSLESNLKAKTMNRFKNNNNKILKTMQRLTRFEPRFIQGGKTWVR